MNSYTKEEQAVAAAAIRKVHMQQVLVKLVKESIEVDGIEIIGKEESDECEDELKMEDVQEAPVCLESYKHKVQNPLKEINLGTDQELRITYISSLLKPELKKEIVELL